MNAIWGIDPGLTGAIVFLSDQEVEIHDMPTLVVSGNKRTISAVGVADILASKKHPCVIEKVASRPGQGVTSMFSFGMGYGIVLGVAAALMIPINYVTPQQWQREMKVQSGKDASRQRAMELYPQHSAFFARKKDHGRADALLIARWGLLLPS
jgi:crossover junction endodeoxyribonuclease RuvC